MFRSSVLFNKPPRQKEHYSLNSAWPISFPAVRAEHANPMTGEAAFFLPKQRLDRLKTDKLSAKQQKASLGSKLVDICHLSHALDEDSRLGTIFVWLPSSLLPTF